MSSLPWLHAAGDASVPIGGARRASEDSHQTSGCRYVGGGAGSVPAPCHLRGPPLLAAVCRTVCQSVTVRGRPAVPEEAVAATDLASRAAESESGVGVDGVGCFSRSRSRSRSR